MIGSSSYCGPLFTDELVQIYLPSILPGAAAPPPPPPPPPPAPLATVVADRSSAFVRRHAYLFAGSALAVTAVGVGYVGLGPAGRRRLWSRVSGAGERGVQAYRDAGELKRALERPLSRDGSRMEVIGKSKRLVQAATSALSDQTLAPTVLLGADATPLGYPLARYLCVLSFIRHQSRADKTIRPRSAASRLATSSSHRSRQRQQLKRSRKAPVASSVHSSWTLKACVLRERSFFLLSM